MKKVPILAIAIVVAILLFWAAVAYHDYHKINQTPPAPIGKTTDVMPAVISIPAKPTSIVRTADLATGCQALPPPQSPDSSATGDDTKSDEPQQAPDKTIGLAVLTADWCGNCKQFEDQELPKLRQEITTPIVEVNVDRKPALAAKLFAPGDKRIPQIVEYQTEPGYDSLDSDEPGAFEQIKPLKHLIGKHNAEEVKKFLAGERAQQDREMQHEVDRKPALAAKLFAPGDKRIPQIVEYQTEPGYDSLDSDEPGAFEQIKPLKHLTGKHNAEEVKKFLAGERAQQDREMQHEGATPVHERRRPRTQPPADSKRPWKR